jgi:hypothetical protein
MVGWLHAFGQNIMAAGTCGRGEQFTSSHGRQKQRKGQQSTVSHFFPPLLPCSHHMLLNSFSHSRFSVHLFLWRDLFQFNLSIFPSNLYFLHLLFGSSSLCLGTWWYTVAYSTSNPTATVSSGQTMLSSHLHLKYLFLLKFWLYFFKILSQLVQ